MRTRMGSNVVSHLVGLLVLLQVYNSRAQDDTGSFWQVTDFHYDANYSETGQPDSMCHDTQDSGDSQTLGLYGDYKCDSPWSLVYSAVKAMKTLKGDPDFILWTGDSVPHVDSSELSENKVYNIIKKVTDLLRTEFNATAIFPSFGNHDPYPSNQMPFDSDASLLYYESIANISGWDKLLKKDNLKTFKTGGYYSSLVNPGLRVISLNTAIYYDSNKLITNQTDPAGQFAWLDKELTLAQSRNEKVIVASHVPPGAFARVKNIVWFNDMYNKKLLQFMYQYQKIIVAQIYGHEHTDSFRVLYDNGKPVMPMFLAPAVTPWNSTLAGAGFNNPSIRLYTYNRFSGAILDYKQYYLNLTDANEKNATKWDLEYTASKDYNIPDVSANSLNTLVSSFKTNKNKYFPKYYRYNSVSSNHDVCDDKCRLLHICAIMNADYEDYHKCLKTPVTTIDPPHADNFPTEPERPRALTKHPHHHPPPHYMRYIIIGLVAVVVVLLILVIIICWRQHRLHLRLSQPRYMRAPSTVQ